MIVLRCTTNVLFGTMLGLQEEIDLATHFMLLANLWRLLARRCLGLGLGVGSPRLNYSDFSAILGYTATLFRRIFSFPHACQIQLDTNLSPQRPQP